MHCVEPTFLLTLESKRRARRSLRLVVETAVNGHLREEVQLNGAPPVPAHLCGERLTPLREFHGRRKVSCVERELCLDVDIRAVDKGITTL